MEDDQSYVEGQGENFSDEVSWSMTFALRESQKVEKMVTWKMIRPTSIPHLPSFETQDGSCFIWLHFQNNSVPRPPPYSKITSN